MPSNLFTRFELGIAGSPIKFAQPFGTPFLALEEDPAIYQIVVPAASAATLWDGSPLPAPFDFLAIVADQTCDIEFTVDGGEADESHFTVMVRAGGFPLIVPGGQSYTGQTGTEDAFTQGTLKNITKIRALNRNTDTAATVSVLVGKAA